MKLNSIYIVYNANGSLIGEVTFLIKKAFNRTSCSACDLTHSFSSMGERNEWKACKKRLPIPVHQVHLDELTDKGPGISEKVQEVGAPCVLGVFEDKSVVTLMGRQHLDEINGQIDKFEAAFYEIIKQHI
jgi:hypothetical protein